MAVKKFDPLPVMEHSPARMLGNKVLPLRKRNCAKVQLGRGLPTSGLVLVSRLCAHRLLAFTHIGSDSIVTVSPHHTLQKWEIYDREPNTNARHLSGALVHSQIVSDEL
jgi:hypothetical protein